MKKYPDLYKRYHLKTAPFSFSKWALITFISLLILSGFLSVRWGIKFSNNGNALKEIIFSFLRPDFGIFGNYFFYALAQTIAIAFLGTLLGAALSFPFSLLASKNFTGHKVSAALGKNLIAVVRSFPELILAVIFIKIVGPGEFAGVLTIGIHSIGMIGRLYAESIDAMEYRTLELIDSVGGDRVHRLVYGVIPQIGSHFISIFLYRFEINIRSSIVIGLVGAGGIGAQLIFSITYHKWSETSAILIGVVSCILIIDAISTTIRKKLSV